MSERYVVTAPVGTAEPTMPESVDVRVVARLDHGLVVDADDTAALESAGWRVKLIPDAHAITLFDYRIDTTSGEEPPVPPEFMAGPESDDGDVNHLVKLVGPVQPSWLDELAERSSLSRRSYLRQFARATGTTPIKWLIEQRIQASLALLESSDLGVEQIAARVGFESPVTFRHHFVRQMRTTPREYRGCFSG
mgnify:CR=1 FL=1